jgi:hypothetical protein
VTMTVMPVELRKLPVPATSLYRGPFFCSLPKRRCEISFEIEEDGGALSKVTLVFDGVEAYRCTYLSSLSANVIKAAYGKLVQVDESPWVAEISQVYDKGGRTSKDLKHLMICFDDGPCFEFICLEFSVKDGG